MANHSYNKLIIYLFFVLAFIVRLLTLVPNLELVTLSLLLASLYLSRNTALKLTVLLMITSDLILGNTNIFIFTWSGFLLPILVIHPLAHYLNKLRPETKLLFVISLGIFSNLFFYLWTNFGVWLLDSWGMYPKTLAGLVNCYINGLPFLKNQLASTFIFIPLGFIIFNWLRNHFQVHTWSLSPQP